MHPNEYRLLALIDVPTLVITGGRVAFANVAAQSLLGSHIEEQDVRIAIRNPDALELLNSGRGGRILLDGLSVTGSTWEMSCNMLPSGEQLVTLTDRSIEISVARAHADFVANASHELRTPLAAVIGYAETLIEPNAGGDAETRDRFLNIIKREAKRMQALVEDLMSLSRIEAIKHDPPLDALDLVRLSREAVSDFGGTKITLDTNVPEAMISGDRGQMAQVLRNLIDNAVKYGKPGGTVAISIEATETKWVSVAIRDEGDGIAPQHLPRITERFYRADASRSREAGGTGLGLSIVKHIVERHRGRFDITSRQGEGTTASLMLKLIET